MASSSYLSPLFNAQPTPVLSDSIDVAMALNDPVPFAHVANFNSSSLRPINVLAIIAPTPDVSDPSSRYQTQERQPQEARFQKYLFPPDGVYEQVVQDKASQIQWNAVSPRILRLDLGEWARSQTVATVCHHLRRRPIDALDARGLFQIGSISGAVSPIFSLQVNESISLTLDFDYDDADKPGAFGSGFEHLWKNSSSVNTIFVTLNSAQTLTHPLDFHDLHLHEQYFPNLHTFVVTGNAFDDTKCWKEILEFIQSHPKLVDVKIADVIIEGDVLSTLAPFGGEIPSISGVTKRRTKKATATKSRKETADTPDQRKYKKPRLSRNTLGNHQVDVSAPHYPPASAWLPSMPPSPSDVRPLGSPPAFELRPGIPSPPPAEFIPPSYAPYSIVPVRAYRGYTARASPSSYSASPLHPATRPIPTPEVSISHSPPESNSGFGSPVPWATGIPTSFFPSAHFALAPDLSPVDSLSTNGPRPLSFSPGAYSHAESASQSESWDQLISTNNTTPPYQVPIYHDAAAWSLSISDSNTESVARSTPSDAPFVSAPPSNPEPIRQPAYLWLTDTPNNLPLEVSPTFTYGSELTSTPFGGPVTPPFTSEVTGDWAAIASSHVATPGFYYHSKPSYAAPPNPATPLSLSSIHGSLWEDTYDESGTPRQSMDFTDNSGVATSTTPSTGAPSYLASPTTSCQGQFGNGIEMRRDYHLAVTSSASSSPQIASTTILLPTSEPLLTPSPSIASASEDWRGLSISDDDWEKISGILQQHDALAPDYIASS